MFDLVYAAERQGGEGVGVGGIGLIEEFEELAEDAELPELFLPLIV